MSQLSIGGGLNNLGNTCFFNATLQAILHTPVLARILDSHHHSQTCRLKQQRQWCVFCELQEVYRSTREAKRFSPSNLINHLKSIFKKFKLGRQEDSHEFLRYLVEGMQEAETGKLGKERESNEAKIRASRTFSVFGGIMKTSVDCLNCNHKSITAERYYDFNIECQRSSTLVEGISSFFAVDKLEGNNKYLCEHCKQKSNARKRFLLESVPQVATFQLKRFTNSMRKIGKFMQFPLVLDLGKFLEAPHKATLKLYAIVVHSGGSSYSGHYYSYIRVAESWYKMDDGYVSKVSQESVLGQTAYLLFYEKDFQEKKDTQSVSVAKMNGVKIVEKEAENSKKVDKVVEKKEGELKSKVESAPLRTLEPQKKQPEVVSPPKVVEKEKQSEPAKQAPKDQHSWSASDAPDAQQPLQQPLQIPSSLKRKRSKQDMQKSIPYQQLILRTFQKVLQLNAKLPRFRPHNQTQRQIYNLRKYQTVMQKKRKIG